MRVFYLKERWGWAAYLISSALFCLFLPLAVSFAQQLYRVNSNNINVRTDSTVTAAVICKVNRGDSVEVVGEFYDWYKIRLPQPAPAFIKKDLVALLDEKTLKVIKDNINVRLSPSERSAIIGRVEKDETLTMLKDEGDWYRVAPPKNSFGWVYKRFVDRINSNAAPKATGGTSKDKGALP